MVFVSQMEGVHVILVSPPRITALLARSVPPASSWHLQVIAKVRLLSESIHLDQPLNITAFSLRARLYRMCGRKRQLRFLPIRVYSRCQRPHSVRCCRIRNFNWNRLSRWQLQQWDDLHSLLTVVPNMLRRHFKQLHHLRSRKIYTKWVLRFDGRKWSL